MGNDARDAAAICRRVLQGGGRTQADGGCWVVSGTTTSRSSGSSSSGLTEDDDQGDDDAASSSPLGGRPVSSSSSSSITSSDDKMQMDVAGPLFELSAMLDHLPSLRTGLSTYYRGRSQSFTSLADVSCVDDLAKKTTPYIRRRQAKAPRCYAAALGANNQLSRKIAKQQVQSSPDSLLSSSKARNASLFGRSSNRPPACHHGRREVVYRYY